MTADHSRSERVDEHDSVRVCVRIRPLTSKEKQEQTKSCIRIAASLHGVSTSSVALRHDSTNIGPQQLIVGKDRAFSFDDVLDVTSSQADTYHSCVAPLVKGFLAGYNATVLAYGQTGTGKTHTMAGAGSDARGREKTEDLQGVIPRVITAVFEQLQHEGEESDNQRRGDYTLRVEYVEIYNEELRDLLHPETSSKQLAIREDGDRNIVIAGVRSESADSKEAVFRHFIVGGASRVTGSTLMNEHSSRSHAIFSLLLEQCDVISGLRRCSKFHLVDLAGSERAKRTGAVACRFKESVSINQGLLALGNVISALGDDKRRIGNASGSTHVPYRDSKLTRLLQDSLGGNTRTLMIACVSPASVNFEETLNTLKYANRAKKIKNKPIVNDCVASDEEHMGSDKAMTRMKEEIASLQMQLQEQKTRPLLADPSLQTSPSKWKPAKHTGTERELEERGHATKCATLYGDAVESMRSYSMEAATQLVAMEREIKSLGRPVQQRLNEIVKLLNASIQTANFSVISARKLVPSPPRRLANDLEPAIDISQQELESIVIQQLRHELKQAKTDLTRDDEIFETKNADLQNLQALLIEAKSKNEKLIQRVQELERGLEMWSNIKGPSSGQRIEPESSSRTTTASHSGQSSRSSATSQSSRGLFARCAQTAVYDEEDDKVVMDTVVDRVEESRYPFALRKSRTGVATICPRGRASLSDSHSSGSRLNTSDAIKKLESTITALQFKVEELQRKNEKLLDTREESTRRWALERQNYERQLSEAEYTIETLKRERHILKDSVLDNTRSKAKDFARTCAMTRSCPTKVCKENDRPGTAALSRLERYLTARNARIKKTVDKETQLAMFDGNGQFHTTRREVVQSRKEKTVVQTLRPSGRVRISTSDLSKSLGEVVATKDITSTCRAYDLWATSASTTGQSPGYGSSIRTPNA